MNKKLPSMIFSIGLCIAGAPVANAQTVGGASITLCNKAVSLGKDYIEAMEHIDRQRLQAGDVSPAEHSATLAQLAVQAQPLSISLCMESQAEQLAFYQCLATHSGKIPACL